MNDDGLSTFERRTVFIGIVGIFLAALSMAAALVAGYFVYQQFKQMEVANNVADIASRRARYDSDKTAIVTARQLAILQGQLTQQQAALNLTERAWITLVTAEFRYHADRQNVDRVDSMISFTNTGPTPAFNIHVWRCSEVLARDPDIRRQPSSGDKRCVESDMGILGTRSPISFETPDFTQVVPKDSLPTSVFAKAPHYYVWGKLTYYTLSKDKRHFLSFCLLNGPQSMGPCAKGNDAD